VTDHWWVCLGTFVTAPWVLWELSRLNAVFRAAHVDRAAFRRLVHRGFVAMGAFQISVALNLFVLGGGAWPNGVAVLLLGIGFILAGTWHPLDRLFAHDG